MLTKLPSSPGVSISMQFSLRRSTTISPLIAHPAVPYPPALIDGESPLVLQNETMLIIKGVLLEAFKVTGKGVRLTG